MKPKNQKRKRGIRKPKGYAAGEIGNNLYIAAHAYLPGNEIVSDEAVHFFGDIQTFSKLMQFELTEMGEVLPGKFAGSKHRVKSLGYNLPLMKFYRMKKHRVGEIPHSLAWDICEHTLRAIQTGDDYFFRDLARLCKFEKARPENPPIALEYWLTLMHSAPSFSSASASGQNFYFTAPELCKLAFMRGFKYGQGEKKIPIRRMHEFCDKLGIKLLDGRRDKRKSDFEMWRRKIQKGS